MRLVLLTPKEWEPIAEDAHLIVFDKFLPSSAQRIDYVLVGENDEGTPLGYVTVREHSETVAYWQFGGAFPSSKGTSLSFRLYKMFLKDAEGKYDIVTTLIENTNTTMLKFAMKVGFVITGIRYMGGSILLEHTIKF